MAELISIDQAFATGTALPAGITTRTVSAVGSIQSRANVAVTITAYLSILVQNESGVTQATGQDVKTITLAPGQNSGQLTFAKQVAVYGGWKVFGQVFIDRVTPQPAPAVAASALQSYTEPVSLGLELVGFGPGVAGLPNGTRQTSDGMPSEYVPGA